MAQHWTSGPMSVYVSGNDRALIHQIAARYNSSVSDALRRAVRREAEHLQLVREEEHATPATAANRAGDRLATSQDL